MDTLGPEKSVQIIQVILYEKVPFGASTKCLDYAGVHIFSSVHINKFHCNIKLGR